METTTDLGESKLFFELVEFAEAARMNSGLFLVPSKVIYLLAGRSQSVEALAGRRNDPEMVCLATDDGLLKFWELGSFEIAEAVNECEDKNASNKFAVTVKRDQESCNSSS